MIRTIVMAPVNVASESDRCHGRDEWRYQVYHSQPGFEATSTFLRENQFPTRVPLGRLGHLVFLLTQAGYHVEFQPLPSRK